MMRRKKIQITLPRYIDDYLLEVMEEMGSNKSDLIEAIIMFISQPENEEAFKSQYGEAEEVEEDSDILANDDEGEEEGKEDV